MQRNWSSSSPDIARVNESNLSRYMSPRKKSELDELQLARLNSNRFHSIRCLFRTLAISCVGCHSGPNHSSATEKAISFSDPIWRLLKQVFFWLIIQTNEFLAGALLLGLPDTGDMEMTHVENQPNETVPELRKERWNVSLEMLCRARAGEVNRKNLRRNFVMRAYAINPLNHTRARL